MQSTGVDLDFVVSCVVVRCVLHNSHNCRAFNAERRNAHDMPMSTSIATLLWSFVRRLFDQATICSCRELLFKCSFDTALVVLQRVRSSVAPTLLLTEALHVLSVYVVVCSSQASQGQSI